MKLEIHCNCGHRFFYSGTSTRYAKCPSCRSRNSIKKLIEKIEKKR